VSLVRVQPSRQSGRGAVGSAIVFRVSKLPLKININIFEKPLDIFIKV